MASTPPKRPGKSQPPNPTQRKYSAVKGKDIKKRKNLTYAEKYEIVKLIDSGERKNKVGEKFGINESTVRGIYSKREHIKSHMNLASVGDGKAVRSSNHVLLKTEQLLAKYFDRMARRNLAVDLREAMDTAKEIYQGVAAKWGIVQPSPFAASRGWFDRFAARRKITNVKICGEAASANVDAAREYPEQLRHIIEEGQYTPDQIFNMDETNFYWKSMPRRTFITARSARCRGRKAIKERFTLLLAMNASGSCRLKPTIVHTAAQPRSYSRENMKALNVHWFKSQKGYVSAKLSLDWLRDCFIPDVKNHCERANIRFNILLLLDNAPGHSPLLTDQDPNVRVEFLPPNTTSLIQPLDQEVIACVKAAYSRRQFRMMRAATEDASVRQKLIESESDEEEEKVIQCNESERRVLKYWKDFKVKHAVDLLVSCWNDVTPATINHAWRNLLEGVPENRRVTVPGPPQSVEAEVEAAVLEARNVPGYGFDETNEDDIRTMTLEHTPTAEELLREDSLREELREEEDNNADSPDEEANEEKKGLPISEIKKLLEYSVQMRHILEQDTVTNNEASIQAIAKALLPYEDIYKTHMNTLTQRKISDYLRRQPPQPPTPTPSTSDDLFNEDSDEEFHGFMADLTHRKGGGGQ